MAVITTEPPSTPTRTPVAQQLSTLDRYLPVWIPKGRNNPGSA